MAGGQVKCAIKSCGKSGVKGYYFIPKDSTRRNAWIQIVEPDANSRIDTLRVCYRHFPVKEFSFAGKQVRISKGKTIRLIIMEIKRKPRCF